MFDPVAVKHHVAQELNNLALSPLIYYANSLRG